MQPNPTAMDSSPVTSSVSSATQEFLKAADLGNDRKKYTAAAPLNSETSSSATERPLADIISDKFQPFDSTKYIITPFEEEHNQDVVVDEEYTTMLLDAVLETHAWASARFKRKSQLECQQLEDQHLRILEKEKEQGMCSSTLSSSTASDVLSFSSSISKFRDGIFEKARESLADFVIKMKKALAALTGVEA